MQIFRFPRIQTLSFDEQQLAMVYEQERYASYIHRSFSLENLGHQIKEKSLPAADRERLVLALQAQYAGIEKGDAVEKNIAALAHENTFTVVTGHQLSMFTGPLYFILKILHTIRLSETLNETYPEQFCVPVYWMATEDHDFAEVQSLNLFNRQVTWQSEQKGAVGRFSAEGLDLVKQEIAEFFTNHPEAEIHALLKAFDGENFAVATRRLVHFLFAEYGLVIVDGDDPALKSSFAPIVKKELTEQFSYHAVTATNVRLKVDGAKIQVNPREINLFYLVDGLRERIEWKDGRYFIEGRGDRSLEQLLEELEMYPERFSPNVVLRPLYQEMILPNLAYVGGLGEIAYWLQLKGVFEAAEVNYPLLSARNSLMWIEPAVSKRMDKIDMHLEDVFLTSDQIKRKFVEEQVGDDLDTTNLDGAVADLGRLMMESIQQLDSSKMSFAESEKVRMEKQMEAFKEKLIRFAKSRNEDAMKHIEAIKDRLFPGDGLQERKTNFFSFCPDGNYRERVAMLHSTLDPFDGDFIVIKEL